MHKQDAPSNTLATTLLPISPAMAYLASWWK
jgi:hypothetical protein